MPCVLGGPQGRALFSHSLPHLPPPPIPAHRPTPVRSLSQAYTTRLIAILVPLFCGGLLIGGLVCWAARKGMLARIAAWRAMTEKRAAPGPGKPVTLVLTDVQGSTELWEWDTELATEGLMLHDKVLRAYLARFFGYEVCGAGGVKCVEQGV